MLQRIAGLVFEQASIQTVEIIAMKNGGVRVNFDAPLAGAEYGYVFPDDSVLTADGHSIGYCAGWNKDYPCN